MRRSIARMDSYTSPGDLVEVFCGGRPVPVKTSNILMGISVRGGVGDS
ncbi:hypothetical protein DFR67_111157 [Williamsia limnetica]|uniref:Uncharacterized protein n=1 Tax=Williamsia limnetica TaxID=882452 RepID=A0A318RS29_WILLI|nr:hypothetical protein DFR67_111157 [Williamsia limnetica]